MRMLLSVFKFCVFHIRKTLDQMRYRTIDGGYDEKKYL